MAAQALHLDLGSCPLAVTMAKCLVPLALASSSIKRGGGAT